MSKQLIEAHGVGNGPGIFHNERRIELFRDAGIPFSRTHDPVGKFGSGEFINIHCIFKNMDADVNDPASYDFQMTDYYIESIVRAGTKVFYRLGETIEGSAHKRPETRKYTYVPKDFTKWAQICEHIIMHYNEGWKDGFRYGIEYWEIWNEPDNISMWSGTNEEFFEFYRVTANYLKDRFPNLKIGGYGSSGFYAAVEPDTPNEWYHSVLKFFKEFIDYITAPETKAPLDFFSWHNYALNIEHIKGYMQFVREYLDSKGLKNTESILNEWNLRCGGMFGGGTEPSTVRKEAKGAAYCASVMARMNKYGVDKGMYYDAEATRAAYCGLFEIHTGDPCKPYFVFKAYNELYKMGGMVDFGIEDDGNITSLGATDGKETALMISNYDGVKTTFNISAEKLAGYKKAEIYLVDEEHELELVEKVYFGKNGVDVSVDKNSIVFIKFM